MLVSLKASLHAPARQLHFFPQLGGFASLAVSSVKASQSYSDEEYFLLFGRSNLYSEQHICSLKGVSKISNTQQISSEMTGQNERWYYADSSNRPCGPLSRSDLDSLAHVGKIRATTLVVREGSTAWVSFDSISTSTELSPLPPPFDPSTTPDEKQKSGVSFAVALGLTLLFCAPIGLIWTALSKRLSIPKKLTICGIAVLWFSIFSIPFVAGFSDGFKSTVHQRSTFAEEISPERPKSPVASEKKTTVTSSTIESAFEVAKQYSAKIDNVLERIENIPNELNADPQQGPMLIGITQEARIAATKIQSDVIEGIQPNFDKIGGDFSSIGGAIGHPLALAAIETKAATTALAMAFARGGSRNESLLPQFKRNLGIAKSAARELRQGISDHLNPDVSAARVAKDDAIKEKAVSRMRQRANQIPPKANAEAQPYRIVNSDIEESSNPDRGTIGNVTIVAPTAQCFEEYILTAKRAAHDFLKANATNRVECVLLPSAESDNLWILAIARLQWNSDSGSGEWELLASRQRFTKEEIQIMEIWAKARAQAPSQLTDDIMAVMTQNYGLKKVDILAVPNNDLETVR